MSKYLPLLLRSFGRSGSTMMMELLGTNENIVFDRIYPFEIRFLAYFVKIARKTEHLEINEEWNPETLLSESYKDYGKFPYNKFDLVAPNEISKIVLEGIWNEFIGRVVERSATIDRNQPIYYAEKTVDHNSVYLNENLLCKNIILLRDPRDEYLSIKSFNKKRGYLAFGWDATDTDESFALKMCNQRKSFLKYFANIEVDQRRFPLKYENFLSEPKRHTEALSEWLGLRLDYDLMKQNEQKFQHHMTSNSVENTRERWKNELSENVLGIFKENIGKELEILGYEI